MRYYVIEHAKLGLLMDLEWSDDTQKCDKPKFAWAVTCTDIGVMSFKTAIEAAEIAGKIDGAYVLQIEKYPLRITDLQGMRR